MYLSSLPNRRIHAGLGLCLSLLTWACSTPSQPSSQALPPSPPPSATNPEPGVVVVEKTAPSSTKDQESLPAPNAPYLDDELRALRYQSQVAVMGNFSRPLPDLLPSPNNGPPGAQYDPQHIPGFFASLELPTASREGEHPLAFFEQALEELESQSRTEPVRIAFYGSSSIAADLWTGYIRQYLQRRFGNGGPGFVSPVKPKPWYRHQEFRVTNSKNWTKHNSYHLQDTEEANDPGFFGAMGQAMSATKRGTWAQLTPAKFALDPQAIRFFELHHLMQEKGGSYQVSLNGKKGQEVSTALSTKGAQPTLGIHRIEVAEGSTHPDPEEKSPTLRYELSSHRKDVRFLGVVAETGTPGIVLDTFGITGAKISNQRFWNKELWSEHLKRRDPALYAFYYGNNESTEEDVPLSVFEKDFRDMLARFQETLPKASCLVIGPGDFPKKVDRDDGTYELAPRPHLEGIRKIEKRLADEYGCAYLDLLKMVGGLGAQEHWVRYGMAKTDYLHFARRGYAHLASGIADALLQHYDWNHRGSDPKKRLDSTAGLSNQASLQKLNSYLHSAWEFLHSSLQDPQEKKAKKGKNGKNKKKKRATKPAQPFLPLWALAVTPSSEDRDDFRRFRNATLGPILFEQEAIDHEGDRVQIKLAFFPDGRLRVASLDLGAVEGPMKPTEASIPNRTKEDLPERSASTGLIQSLDASLQTLLSQLTSERCSELPLLSAGEKSSLSEELRKQFSLDVQTLQSRCGELEGKDGTWYRGSNSFQLYLQTRSKNSWLSSSFLESTEKAVTLASPLLQDDLP